MPDELFSVEFPPGTYVGDRRNETHYQVGDENTADEEMFRLVEEAKELYAELLEHRAAAERWPSLAISGLKWLAGGLLIGACLKKLQIAVGQRMRRTNVA